MHDWRHHDRIHHNPHCGEFGGNEWRPQYRIDYSPHGDNIDRVVLKVRNELDMIYHLLNRLRKLDASVGNVTDAVAYQLHADTASGRLLIRDAKNERWLELGKLGESFFGIQPEDIGAVRSKGTGAFYSGNAADRPLKAEFHDVFYSLDEKKIYFYSGTAWEVLASLDFADLYGTEEIASLDSDGAVHATLDGKFQTARKIAIEGDASGSAYFDGSADVAINLSVATALSAANDGAGNNISETYATKAGLSAFVTKNELAEALADSELIIKNDIVALFDGSASAINWGTSIAWADFEIANEADIVKLFGEEA